MSHLSGDSSLHIVRCLILSCRFSTGNSRFHGCYGIVFLICIVLILLREYCAVLHDRSPCSSAPVCRDYHETSASQAPVQEGGSLWPGNLGQDRGERGVGSSSTVTLGRKTGEIHTGTAADKRPELEMPVSENYFLKYIKLLVTLGSLAKSAPISPHQQTTISNGSSPVPLSWREGSSPDPAVMLGDGGIGELSRNAPAVPRPPAQQDNEDNEVSNR